MIIDDLFEQNSGKKIHNQTEDRVDNEKETVRLPPAMTGRDPTKPYVDIPGTPYTVSMRGDDATDQQDARHLGTFISSVPMPLTKIGGMVMRYLGQPDFLPTGEKVARAMDSAGAPSVDRHLDLERQRKAKPMKEQDIDPDSGPERSPYPPEKDFPNWYDMRDRKFEVHRNDGTIDFIQPGTDEWNDIYDRQFPDHPRPDNLRDVYSDGNPVAEGSVTPNVSVNKIYDDGNIKEWHIYRGEEMIGFVVKNLPDTAEGLYIASGYGPGRGFTEEFTGLKSAVNFIASLDTQGVAEGSKDDIEDTRQFKNAIALAKSQKAIRQAKDGKDAKYYADGTKVTPDEVARRAAERKAKKQGVAEAIPYALSAANAAAEYRRQGQAGGGYQGRIDIPVQSREDYLAVGRTLTKAARAAGEKIDFGLSDGVMSVFSDTMTADELDQFIDDVLDQGLAEGSLDPSGLIAAAKMVRDFIITAEVGGKTKKFRIRGMTGPGAAKERFLKHHSMAKVLDVKPEQGVAEAEDQQLSVNQLAMISDEALDNAYGYGRSSPGNTFGWQANLMSAAYAKKMIDAGVTDIEKISDAIHKGWNVTAQKFVQNPDQFDDTEKLRQAGKLDAKLAQRAKLMRIGYFELDNDEQEKDRVVARALLQAIKGEQGVAEAEDQQLLVNLDINDKEGLILDLALNNRVIDYLKLFANIAGKELLGHLPDEAQVDAYRYAHKLDDLGMEMLSNWKNQHNPRIKQEISHLGKKWYSLFKQAYDYFVNLGNQFGQEQSVAEGGFDIPEIPRAQDPKPPKPVKENMAAGISKFYNNAYDPVTANLQRVALLAMQGRQDEAMGQLRSVIKTADPDTQQKIIAAVNNINPVMIQGRVATSSELDNSKPHRDYILQTFLPWVQGMLTRSKSLQESTVRDRLHKLHQEIRSKNKRPDPRYYKELGASYDIEDDQKRLAAQKEIKQRHGVKEQRMTCPECGGAAYEDKILAEKQDACYHKVKSRYKVWPSAYASGALVRCRKKGAANWGNKSKK